MAHQALKQFQQAAAVKVQHSHADGYLFHWVFNHVLWQDHSFSWVSSREEIPVSSREE